MSKDVITPPTSSVGIRNSVVDPLNFSNHSLFEHGGYYDSGDNNHTGDESLHSSSVVTDRWRTDSPIVDETDAIARRERLIVHLLRKLCTVVDPSAATFVEQCKRLRDLKLLTCVPFDDDDDDDADDDEDDGNQFDRNQFGGGGGAREILLDDNDYRADDSINSICVSRFNHEFSDVEQIGRGSFGKVYRAKHEIDSAFYAIKVIHFKQRNPKVQPRKMLREVTCLAKLDHPNIIRYYNAWIEPVTLERRNFERSKSDHRSAPSSRSKAAVLVEDHFGLKRSSSNPVRSSLPSAYNEEEEFLPGTPKRESMSDLLLPLPPLIGGGGLESLDSLETDGELNTDGEPAVTHMDYSLDSIISPNVSSSELKPQFHSPDCSPVGAHKTPMRTTASTLPRNTVVVGATPRRWLQPASSPSSSGSPQRVVTRKRANSAQRFKLYIQMQLCEGPNLTDWLMSEERRGTPISNAVNMPILYQVLLGLQHIHGQGVIHRDLKPDNLFITVHSTASTAGSVFHELSKTPKLPGASYMVKIGDFGLAKNHVDESDGVEFGEVFIRGHNHGERRNGDNTGVGTVTYSSPEQISGQLYSTKSDIYSLGIIMFEMYNKFSTGMERAISITNLRKGKLESDFCSQFPVESELILAMTKDRTSQRPSAVKLLSHPYVQRFANVPTLLSSPVISNNSGSSSSSCTQPPTLTLAPSAGAHSSLSTSGVTSMLPTTISTHAHSRDELLAMSKEELVDRLLMMRTTN